MDTIGIVGILQSYGVCGRFRSEGWGVWGKGVQGTWFSGFRVYINVKGLSVHVGACIFVISFIGFRLCVGPHITQARG